MKRYMILLMISSLLFCTSCNGIDTEQEQAIDNMPEESTITQNADTAISPSLSDSAPDEEQTSQMDSDDFATIRARVPYEGLIKVNRGYVLPIPSFLESEDKIGSIIEQYVITISIGEQEILSRNDLSDDHIIGTAINATTPYAVEPNFRDYTFCPDLEPIGTLIRKETASYLFWLKEHVEQSIKLLYGEDIAPQNILYGYGDYHYSETFGVYYLPPRGGGLWRSPVILGYEDLGDCYRVEVAYIRNNVTSYQNADTGENIAYYDDEGVSDILADYIQKQSNHYHLYLIKQENSLLFDKQTLIS